VRLDIRRIGSIKEGERIIGNRTRVKVVKNKVAPPFREAEFDILYNEGISQEGELIDIAVDKGIIAKSGVWFSYEGERIGQGRENARLYLKQEPELTQKVKKAVLEGLGLEKEEKVAEEKKSQAPAR
jgi:recombination protein RecA